MATLIDDVQTRLRVIGAVESQRGLKLMEDQMKALSRAETQMIAWSDTLGNTLGLLGNIAGGVAVAGLTAAGAAIGKSITAFEQYEVALTRASVVLGNMKGNFPTNELGQFAQRMGEAAGVSDRAVVELAQVMGEFGFSGNQIERFTPAILNASRELHRSGEEIFKILEAAQLGRSRGLFQLGLPVLARRGGQIPIGTSLEALEQRYKGGAAAVRATGAGSQEALNAAVERLERTMGEKLDPDLNRFRNDLTASLNLLSQRLHESTGNRWTSPWNAVAAYFRDTQRSWHNLGSEIARRQIAHQRHNGTAPPPNHHAKMERHAQQQTDSLRQIATYTRMIGSPIRGGGNYSQHAFAIRDFNMAFKNGS